jgi:hypothetical protein
MFLTIFVCALAGSPCHALPLPPGVADHRFPSFEECMGAVLDIERIWLAAHRDWQEGGVHCAMDGPK